MKSSSGTADAGGFLLLPVGDEDLVGVFGLLGDGSFLAPLLFAVIGRAGPAMIAATGFGPGGELELAPLVGDQAGPGEGIVRFPPNRGGLPMLPLW